MKDYYAMDENEIKVEALRTMAGLLNDMAEHCAIGGEVTDDRFLQLGQRVHEGWELMRQMVGTELALKHQMALASSAPVETIVIPDTIPEDWK